MRSTHTFQTFYMGQVVCHDVHCVRPQETVAMGLNIDSTTLHLY